MNFLLSNEQTKTNYYNSLSLNKKILYFDKIFYSFKLKKKLLIFRKNLFN